MVGPLCSGSSPKSNSFMIIHVSRTSQTYIVVVDLELVVQTEAAARIVAARIAVAAVMNMVLQQNNAQ